MLFVIMQDHHRRLSRRSRIPALMKTYAIDRTTADTTVALKNRLPVNSEQYASLVSSMTPPSKHVRGCFRAFWVGGVICCIGQALNLLGEKLPLTELTAPMFTSVILIFLGFAASFYLGDFHAHNARLRAILTKQPPETKKE